MHIPIYILLLFLFNFAINGMDGDRRNRLFFPDYVPNNTNFDVSLITSARVDSTETLEFQIIFDQNVTVNFVEARTTGKTIKVSHTLIMSDNPSQTGYKVTLSNKMLNMQPGDFYQVLWNLNSGNTDKIFINVIQLVKVKDKILKKDFQFYL